MTAQQEPCGPADCAACTTPIVIPAEMLRCNPADQVAVAYADVEAAVRRWRPAGEAQ